MQEEMNKIAADSDKTHEELENVTEELLGKSDTIASKLRQIESQTLVRCSTEKATREQTLNRMQIEIENKFHATDERLNYLQERLNEEEMI